jgi:hypothetical protein
MVNNGHPAMSAKKKQAYIEQLNYRASGSYPLDLEIFSVSDLRQRVGEGFLRSTHRYRFHMLVCVTRGECTHMIDFKLIACKPGSLSDFSRTRPCRREYRRLFGMPPIRDVKTLRNTTPPRTGT